MDHKLRELDWASRNTLSMAVKDWHTKVTFASLLHAHVVIIIIIAILFSRHLVQHPFIIIIIVIKENYFPCVRSKSNNR